MELKKITGKGIEIGHDNSRKILLVGIIILGFILRVVGYDWGGVHSTFHPDEDRIISNIMYMVENRSYVCHGWIYPSMSTSKLIALCIGVIQNFCNVRTIDYYYISRFFYSVFSTACIFLSYIIVKKTEDRDAALIFSALVAVCPSFVKFSKFAVGDTPVMMFWLLVAFFSFEYISKRKKSNLVIMSAFASLATLEKWNGMVICIYIAIVVVYTGIKERNWLLFLKHGMIAFFSWIGGIIILAPNIIAEREMVIQSIWYANWHLGFENIFLTSHGNIFFSYLGLVSVILALAGLFISIRRGMVGERLVYLIPCISLVIEWLIDCMLLERHGLILYWGLLLAIVVALREIKKVHFLQKPKATYCILTCLVFASFLVGSLLFVVISKRADAIDARAKGEKMFAEMGVDIDNSLADLYTPLFPGGYREGGHVKGIAASNLMNKYFYYDTDGIPSCNVPDIKYAVIGGYVSDHVGEGYDIIRRYGTKIAEVKSDGELLELFISQGGQGKWYYLEADTIRLTLKAIKVVMSDSTIGPSFELYDVSDIQYVSEE